MTCTFWGPVWVSPCKHSEKKGPRHAWLSAGGKGPQNTAENSKKIAGKGYGCPLAIKRLEKNGPRYGPSIEKRSTKQ